MTHEDKKLVRVAAAVVLYAVLVGIVLNDLGVQMLQG